MQRISLNICQLIILATLSVGLTSASTVVYAPGTYFALAPDGLSYNGKPIPIGGTNPKPLDATLTGNFSTTSITVNGGTITILPTFTVTITDSPNLMDGDDAVIDATDGTHLYPVGVLSWDVIFPGNNGEFDITNLTGPNALPPDFPITSSLGLSNLTLTVDFPGGTTGVPEPASSIFVITGLAGLAFYRRRFTARAIKAALKLTSSKIVVCITAILCLCAARSAFGQVMLTTETTPSSGVAGVTNVSVIGEGFPSGTITPANIIVTMSSTCGGAPAATSIGTSIRKILGSTERVNFNIPGGISPGTYYVTLADSAGGDANFTTLAGSCSAVQVTGSFTGLNSCVATSSMGVLLPSGSTSGTVTAYVPKGYWDGSSTGVVVQNIEGTINPSVTIPTAHITNSCSSNPNTGQTVCVANNTDVYLISGTTVTNTLTSSSNRFASFSGGSCNNCGVAIDALHNTAVINMGVAGGSSGDGVQVLNLNTNTFNAPLPMNQTVSENISVNPNQNLILSADEDGYYPIVQIQSDGSLKEFDSTFNSGIDNDSSTEDCSTGIAIAPGEYSNSVQLVNLNNITFGTTTYTAPNAIVTLVSNYGFSAGLDGSAVAQGSGHLAVVTGEFGGNTFAVLQLPSVPGTGTPTVVDYAVAEIPANAACGGTFSAGFDPHTVTAYTSPNTGDAYAVFAGYSSASAGVGVPICLAVVDMSVLINPARAPRGGSGYQAHDISPANFPAGAVTFFKF